jgi:uroporphyrin-III C-methyltransferase/precorrin-2 dehydrogenase/sirohydrochlorin ferrochelatase
MNPLRSDGVRAVRRGKVWLVGAGPGDPDLMTVRAHRLVSGADVLAYDELVPDAILDLAPSGAERIPVGRRAGGCRHHEARIHPLVVVRAIEGREVIRLKGGDPFIFGRGGEEAEELAAANVPFEVVPGVSAALAAAAASHIPLTHRDASSSVTLVTAHSRDGQATLPATLPPDGTVVLYMGLGLLESTLKALMAGGRSPLLPAAVVSHAGRARTETIIGTLDTLAAKVALAGVKSPAVVIVGQVVARAVASPVAANVLLASAIANAR